jgi:hypothetical protein
MSLFLCTDDQLASLPYRLFTSPVQHFQLSILVLTGECLQKKFRGRNFFVCSQSGFDHPEEDVEKIVDPP